MYREEREGGISRIFHCRRIQKGKLQNEIVIRYTALRCTARVLEDQVTLFQAAVLGSDLQKKCGRNVDLKNTQYFETL